jgi:hypothetical protein
VRANDDGEPWPRKGRPALEDGRNDLVNHTSGLGGAEASSCSRRRLDHGVLATSRAEVAEESRRRSLSKLHDVQGSAKQRTTPSSCDRWMQRPVLLHSRSSRYRGPEQPLLHFTRHQKWDAQRVLHNVRHALSHSSAAIYFPPSVNA